MNHEALVALTTNAINYGVMSAVEKSELALKTLIAIRSKLISAEHVEQARDKIALGRVRDGSVRAPADEN